MQYIDYQELTNLYRNMAMINAFLALWELSPRHQNQPPDGSTPLRRRYVTRFP
jgi:hypothetical protein